MSYSLKTTGSVYNHYHDNATMAITDTNNLGNSVRQSLAKTQKQTIYIPVSSLFGFTRSLDKVFRGLRFQIQLHKADKQVVE